jgi:hypothetical protein
VKQSEAVIEGMATNIEAKIKKRQPPTTTINMKEVIESVKEFIKEMGGKYAIIDRPPLPKGEENKTEVKKEEVKK